MSCIKLYKGQDYSCTPIYKKYYQQVVLINKSDVKQFVINGPTISLPSSAQKHRIRFKTKQKRVSFSGK